MGCGPGPQDLLHGKAGQVAAGMPAPRHRLRLLRRERARDEIARYLENKKDYLGYPAALAKGWPIATGVIEGACRHIVKDRMDITGARWGLEGAEAILKLRALTASGDFDAYWRYHPPQRTRTHPPREIPRNLRPRSVTSSPQKSRTHLRRHTASLLVVARAPGAVFRQAKNHR